MILQLLNGTQYDIANYSLKRLFHRIPSVGITHDTASVDGRSDIIVDSRFTDRTISVELLYESNDIYDYYLIRDEINALFTRQEAFYIIFKREPYKRWKVRLASGFETEPNPHMQSFTVEFICDGIFAESIATTADVKEWDTDKWAWNGQIDWDEDLAYSFNTNSFTVANLGNVTIDPRMHDLEITVKGNFTSNLTIVNNTTGDTYQYTRSIGSSDTLTLTGIRTMRNGVSDFKSTNKKLLTLASGDNSFTVNGGTITSISFNFRFLYK